MPAALNKEVLSTMKFTAEEKRVALINVSGYDQKALNSKKASLKAFLKQNPDKASADAANKKEKEEVLVRFVIHTLRCKLTEKTYTAIRHMTSLKKIIKTIKWMGEERMIIKFGPILSAHWIECDKLPIRPNRLSGSMQRYLMEFGIPDGIEEKSESELKSLKQQAEWEMSEEDVDAWEDLCKMHGFENMLTITAPASSTTGSSSSDVVVVEKSTEDVLSEQLQELKEQAAPTLLKFQAQKTELGVIKAKADNHTDTEMIGSFCKAIQGSLVKTGRLVVMLEQLVQEPDSVNAHKVPDFLKLIQETDARFSNHVEWAIKFGCGGATKSKKQRT